MTPKGNLGKAGPRGDVILPKPSAAISCLVRSGNDARSRLQHPPKTLITGGP